ncbi:MAG TPA: hypothetical protein VER83_02770 [Candidatus Nanopelagicales bacterium]|nr:hypothetical protein [Candidatus Nanopelagicales bacterium]
MAVAQLPVCLQCGTLARRPGVTVCGRCGLAFGERPREDATLPSCPVCYREIAPDGLIASPAAPPRRVSLAVHVDDHDRAPVGDDEWLESLREGNRVRIGRWRAPFDLVRRYLVTGVVDAGRTRAARHDAIVTAMTQLARWGSGAAVLGDQPEWAEARAAIADLLERYHRR